MARLHTYMHSVSSLSPSVRPASCPSCLLSVRTLLVPYTRLIPKLVSSTAALFPVLYHNIVSLQNIHFSLSIFLFIHSWSYFTQSTFTPPFSTYCTNTNTHKPCKRPHPFSYTQTLSTFFFFIFFLTLLCMFLTQQTNTPPPPPLTTLPISNKITKSQNHAKTHKPFTHLVRSYCLHLFCILLNKIATAYLYLLINAPSFFYSTLSSSPT